MEPRLADSCSFSLHLKALSPALWGMCVIRGSIPSSVMLTPQSEPCKTNLENSASQSVPRGAPDSTEGSWDYEQVTDGS